MSRGVVVVALLLALGGPARADEDQARELHEQAKGKYNVAAYDEAIVLWKEAYVLSRAPLLLFNIAQAYRLKGDCAQALRFYANYEREEPAPANRAELDAAKKLCAEAEPPPPPPLSERRSSSEPPGRGKKQAGLYIGAAGLVLVAAGAIFGARSLIASDELDGYRGDWGPDQQALEASGERDEVIAVVLTSAGAAALVTGTVLYFLGAREERVALQPVRGGGAVMTYSVSF